MTNMQNIHEWRGKIKGSTDDWLHDWGLVAVVIVASVAAFGLGRLSAAEVVRPAVTVLQAPAKGAIPPIPQGGMIVGSRGGSAYHYPWCAGATNIAPQNQIWFANEKEAQEAGYRPSKNCKGLSIE